MASPIALVALIDRPTDLTKAAAVLAEAAGLAPAEARMRLAPEPPAVVQRLPASEAAALAKALTAAGAPSLDLDPDARELPTLVRGFELGPAQVTFVERDGTETEVGYGDIRLILRGLRLTKSETTRTETERKFSLGKAVLTQGLMMTKVEKREVRSEVTTPFHAALCFGPTGALLLDESELTYQSLGTALKPSRLENLNTIVAELRKRAPQARYDDRLLRLGSRSLALQAGDPFDTIAEILNQAQLRGLW